MITIMGLVHGNKFVVNMELPDGRRACYVLVALNDMVINAYEINQIHVTFYFG